MKQIDEVPSQNLNNANKLFETPQKKEKTKRPHEIKAYEQMLLQIEDKHKFDLGESPRFIGSTKINPQNQSSIKKFSASSIHKKNYSPVLIKIQENDQVPTPEKYVYEKNKQIYFEEKYGDLSDEKNLMKCYEDLMNDIRNGKTNIMIPTPEILSSCFEDECIYSQLVTFNMNPKNSRKIVYNEEKRTIAPIFECLGCKTDFFNASALGGHLSRCQKKNLHYEKLKEYYQSCQIIEEQDQEDEEDQKEKKEFLSESQKLEVIETPKKQKIFKEHEKEIPYFYSSSESKSVEKNLQKAGKKYFDHHEMEIEAHYDKNQDKISQQHEKTLKKISRKAFIPNKSRGKNKKIFKFTKIH